MTEQVCQDERVGVYPGSFDPPTIAHLAIAIGARRASNLDRVELVVSRHALGKPEQEHAPFDLRIKVIEASISHASWLSVHVTDAQLITDIADGYDVVIMGGDKWAQVCDVAFYGDEPARDAAVSALPQIAATTRPGAPPLPDHAIIFELPERLANVSSSGAREGESGWMTPAARRAAEANGIWGS